MVKEICNLQLTLRKTSLLYFMDNILLNLSERIVGPDGFAETSKIVKTDNKDILNTPVAQYVKSKLSRFVFTNPDSQDIFAPVQINVDKHVGGLVLRPFGVREFSYYQLRNSCVADAKKGVYLDESITRRR